MDKELEEAIKRLKAEKETGIFFVTNVTDIELVLNYIENSIPTSVVREKIQAYSKNCTVINSFIVDVLQELLQEKGEK